MSHPSPRSRFLLRSFAVTIGGVCAIAVAAAVWTWATTVTHVVVYRLETPEAAPSPDALNRTVEIVSNRLKALRTDLELGRCAVRALPPDRLEFSVRCRQSPDYALAWLAMQGRAEFRLRHPDAQVVDGPERLPDGYEVKVYTERRHILTRLNELKAVPHHYAVLREPVMAVDGFRHVGFDTVGAQRAVLLTFEFHQEDERRFAAVTALHAGRQMAMLIDGEMFFPPAPIREAIAGGRVQIQGFFLKRPMRRLARLLECGSLPGRLVRVEPSPSQQKGNE
ncbi:MAG: hypothetical protein GXY85_07155 [Candidatus Brocadiaceae bacterium]|nr:hypothetical protein [Candidatus Brocadiaceae bacterium]